MVGRNKSQTSLVARQKDGELTHSCPYESARSVTLFESQRSRIPNR